MDITLTNLTLSQQRFCTIIYNLNGSAEVHAFIDTLPKADQMTCWSLIELMALAIVDQTESIDEAQAILKQFTDTGN